MKEAEYDSEIKDVCSLLHSSENIKVRKSSLRSASKHKHDT